MKRTFIIFISIALLCACQKNVSTTPARPQLNQPQDSSLPGGDSITYEVITDDNRGWWGIWSLPDGSLKGAALTDTTFGSPVYLPSGWRYSFPSPATSFDAFISTATSTYSDNITVNLYQKGKLIKSVTNDAMKGMTKLMSHINGDSLTGSTGRPLLTYEVMVTDPDVSKFESGSWVGSWLTSEGTYSTRETYLLTLDFPIPSGWRYSFTPDKLPFTMEFYAGPYTKFGGKVTINFYVNNALVKSQSTRDWIYRMQYDVQ